MRAPVAAAGSTRARAAVAAAACTLAIAGCNGDDDGRNPVAGDAARAGDVVVRLERALARRDFGTVCRRLFSRALRERLGGGRCPSRLRGSARGVRRPRIRVEAISLQGSRARVRVVTSAARQAPARDVIVLVEERGNYRIDGLGTTGER